MHCTADLLLIQTRSLLIHWNAAADPVKYSTKTHKQMMNHCRICSIT